MEKNMTCIVGDNIKTVIREANTFGIKREDVVSLMKDNGQYFLIYYG